VNVSTTNPDAVRALAKSPLFKARNLYEAAPNGHKFTVGETRTLTGLVGFPEHNGETVTITGIREDGPRGKAYYVSGRIAECGPNWVYEFRLQ
jgi:hypothetical protein